MALNDVHEVVLSYSVGSVPVLNVLHVRESTSIVLADSRINAEAIAAAIIASDWMAALLAIVAEDVTINSVNVRRVSPAPDVPFHRILGATETLSGSRTGEVVPPQAGLLMSLYSAENSRSGRGRMFVPGISEDDQNEGKVLEAYYIDVVDDFENIFGAAMPMSGADTGEIVWTVWSRTLAQANDVLIALAHPNLATIRGRRAREGFGA